MSTKSADKVESAVPSMAMLRTGNGGTIELLDKASAPGKATDVEDRDESGGVLYTDELPKLEDLLGRYDIQFAVLDKLSEPIAPETLGKASRGSTDLSKSFSRAVVLGGFPAIVLTAGVLMMLGATVGASTVTNPYLGFFLILSGLTLGATSWAALREARRRT